VRPVNRGAAPAVYARYDDAKQDLVNRLGSYCSYCERRIPTLLAVEHIQPKGLPQYAHLENEWTNFLLACVNCNSAKASTPVECDFCLLPDRDNTFAAFIYDDLGTVEPHPGIGPAATALAAALRDLTALNRMEHPDWDEAVAFSALARVGQRVQAWLQAQDARADYDAGRTWTGAIAREAAATGFFSIWMAAFEGVPDVRQALIATFPNTADDCFDAMTASVSPRPGNGLVFGGRV
jgi:uncharacterized protein (TIGR02646 family)